MVKDHVSVCHSSGHRAGFLQQSSAAPFLAQRRWTLGLVDGWLVSRKSPQS